MRRGDHYDQRLNDPERVQVPEHLEVARLLGEDRELVLDVMQAAKLAPSSSRVAIALAEGGPYVLFERTGARVTCLAPKSAIYDAEVVPSTRLFGVIAQRADRKERFEAAQQLTGEQNPARAMLHRILYAGRSLSREEFHAFAWLAPVLAKIFYDLYVEGWLTMRSRCSASGRSGRP